MECADVTAKKRKSQTGTGRAACLVEGVLDLHVVSDSETVRQFLSHFVFSHAFFAVIARKSMDALKCNMYIPACLLISLAFFLIYVASSCLQACA